MLTQKVLAALTGAVMMIGGEVSAQPGTQSRAKLGAKSTDVHTCRQECAGDPICVWSCGDQESKVKTTRPPGTKPDPQPEPPAVKNWRDDVLSPPSGGGGGGSGR